MSPKEDHLACWIAKVAKRHNRWAFAKFVDKPTMQRLSKYGPAPYGMQIGLNLYVRNDLEYPETKEVLLHELAHLLCPPGELNRKEGSRRSPRRDIHSWVFWEMFWDLAEEEGLVEECRPYVYMKRGIKVYERRYAPA